MSHIYGNEEILKTLTTRSVTTFSENKLIVDLKNDKLSWNTLYPMIFTRSIYVKSISSINTSSEKPITHKRFARDEPNRLLCPLVWLLSTQLNRLFQPNSPQLEKCLCANANKKLKKWQTFLKWTVPNDVYKSIYGKYPSSTNTSSEYPITRRCF